jgi:hypothetical protein
MSDRSKEELLEMIQQISKTRNVDRANELIDRFNGEVKREEIPTLDKLSK